MPEEKGMELGELLDPDEIRLLEAEAAKRGMNPAELAQLGIQQELTRRTRPRAMTGTIQAFRKKH
ncbi:hypothetical protein HBO15_23620 [Pseudomonas sp. WS 5111]|jgi:hypothetical protein|uniref:hypothetical protein n=1 Tax=unclassified Pseudomonas TaxID=196821 RepID=UPI0014729247|nr:MULTISPECIES: hypothetical protein [unclassified Pseudomonas]NMX64402.1 hypothetical protein [Pseudomonas sp. WS 5079]NMX70350.1 hypothetical protein [Pseudomonas sp. WS 5111]NMX84442.1 hypothetical protein [Pseudomonas sp. WS 5010]